MKKYLLLTSIAAVASFGAPVRFTLGDTAGATHTEAEWQKSSGVVIYFITTDCPVSNSYVPEMNRIAQNYSARGVRFYGVIADTDTALDEVRKHVKDFGYTFPILIDSHQVLVKLTNADVTPEAAVLTAGGDLKYLGRIDNRVVSFSQHRQQATEHDLKDALDAVLAGKTPAKASAPAVGCTINRVK